LKQISAPALHSSSVDGIHGAAGPERYADVDSTIQQFMVGSTLELKDLLLADREAVGFLRACLEKGIELRNCPRYIRTWMESDDDGARQL
jgi:hypothetical protein